MNSAVQSYQRARAVPCEGCKYLSHICTCDYIFMMHQRRPCPPGDDCTVKKTDGTKKKRTWDDGCVMAPEAKPKKGRKRKGQTESEKYTNAERMRRKRARNKERFAQTQKVIREVRRSHGVTTDELSQRFGVTTSLICQWERGEVRANWEKLALIFPELAQYASQEEQSETEQKENAG